jgi:hypothetical protein
MTQQISRFITLCFFMQNHQDLPRSQKLLRISLVIHFFLGLVILALMIDPVEASIQISAKMVFSLFFVLIAVLFARKFSLFLPAITAIIMCENLIAFIGLPVAFWMHSVEEVVIPFYISVALVVWGLAVTGFILRKLFSIKLGSAAMVSVLYFLVADLGSFLLLYA